MARGLRRQRTLQLHSVMLFPFLRLERRERIDGPESDSNHIVEREKDGGMEAGTEGVDWHGYVDGMKSFSHRHGYDGLVVLLSINDTVHHPRQQMAVYSNNTDLLNQICCELEESSSWSLSGKLEARESLQVYHIPINTCLTSGTSPLLAEEIQGLLKDFVDRRSSVLACHPSSRTSSTEGVAGSVEFSQGSSGINDMDGSDIERAEGGIGDVVPIARVMADGEEDTGSIGVGAGGELVSPDSGLTTIRSSRSSKESSVFLSDDSPVGEIIAAGGQAAGPGGLFLRNPSPLGLSSLSPPVPPERRKNHSGRNKSENFDRFSFDPVHSSDQSTPRRGELENSRVGGDEGVGRAGSSSLSELEELSLLDFSAPNSFGGLESRNSSIDHHGRIHGNDMIETVVPPTPVNSVVGSRPTSRCGVRFFPEDVVERINGLQHKDSVSSSLSETWEELGFDTQGALSSNDNDAWNRTKESESLQNIVEEVRGKDSVDYVTEQESREEILKSENAHQKKKSLEPQLSLITEQTENYDTWNPDHVRNDQWNPVTLAYLQLTPSEAEVTGKCKADIIGVKEKTSSLSRKKSILTLTPDTSKEDDEGVQGEKAERQTELLDFWTYSAQKGFLKSDSGTTTSYPESLDMWNMTIWDDSLSPLTTPENLSGNSGSFCGGNPNVGTSVESPLGFSDGGMVMWNTTIQEDSSSTITSPEGAENGKDLSHMGSLDASDSPETHACKQEEEQKAVEEEICINKLLCQTPKDLGWRGYEHNVKIVIEPAEGRTQEEETGDSDIQSFQRQQCVLQNLASEHSEDETFPYQGTNMCDLPVPSMVTSTSEYDNVGAGTWSLTSSPETYPSPVVHMIQLEQQSSPFVAVTKPIQVDERHTQYEKNGPLGQTDYRAVILDKEQPTNQVFLFEGASELGHMTSSESKYDNKSGEGSEEADHSPFVLVDCSLVTQTTSANHHASPGEAAETQIQADQSFSPSIFELDEFVSKKHVLSFTMPQNKDGPTTESQCGTGNWSIGNVVGETTEAMSLSSSSGGDRDTLKYSPDSLHPGSQDELRSNSDGDSSSGLEMDYIIVSGTVKEAEREFHDRPKQADLFMIKGSCDLIVKRVVQSLCREKTEGGKGRQSQQGDGAAGMMASSEEVAKERDNKEDPLSSADLSGGSNQRRKLAAPPMNVSLDCSEGSLLSEDALDTEDEALDTGNSKESNLGAGAASSDAMAGHRSAEESRENRLWRSVMIGEQEHRIDMKCIEPYKRVISHGGYYAEQNAIIVFAACFLPDSDCDNYNYVMENLFLYVISTLELMVAEDYMIVYLNGATPRRRMPGFTWMKKCYQMIDRRLKKNLKMFIIVHPSWFIRTLLGITRPFISSKFSSKIKYVNSLQELGEIIPMEFVYIPPSIVKADKTGKSFV
ncbi:hypothetical protein FQN60_017645 [Etheostoma spectabile]|uniref:CRAL-TRIO domain-containing protein n=1 Tax=Etheostoma spectabile TaxID=54343 RepID=A0A5J5DG70_9PERO|nr:hypothetical protein FQN60_017645 [Etheostoma spectabile]